MTRTNRAGRSGPAHQPLYARMLRLRHLAPSGLLCFVFLEGAVVLGILLALAELVSWWGVVVLPVTVALMVKFNDLVAGAVVPRPVATEAAPGRTAVLRPAAMPAAMPAASADGFTSAGGARMPSAEGAGVYGSVSAGRGHHGGQGGFTSGFHGGSSAERPGFEGERPHGYGAYGSSAGRGDGLGVRSAGAGRMADDRFASYGPARHAEVGQPGEYTPSPAPVTGGFTPAVMPLGGGCAPIVSPEPSALGYDPATSLDGMSEVPAVGYPGSYSRGLSGTGSSAGSSPSSSSSAGWHGDEGQRQVRSAAEPVVEEHRGNHAPIRRAWTDERDVRQQMARQAASRRYE
ncbi:hypothetical protein Aph02nite_85910 [Actinoplanes philippinensis]|uniref:Uncharacterized protein n=1 Tax=Actinoplanes philippinensis TaxID=35752 RepID=A0A1I2LVW9_9ACTN|nr:hypothetical protein Aph02nite_85910 [Actinoplanes philippinensis]SFF81216.1 hypothetical protein SAMN05421541_12358 [Actinoplanes philippinensis]